MSEVLTIVRLRWALTWATMKKSSWQTVGFIISLILVLGAVVSAWSASWNLGPQLAADGATLEVARAILLDAMSALTVFIVIIQLMVIGEGSTLNPQRFALFGIPDRKLQAGLLCAGLVGLPAICGFLCFASLAALYRGLGPVMVLTAVISALIAVVTMMSISKMVLSLATTLANSQRAQNVLYLVVFLLFLSMCYAPQIIAPSGPSGHLEFAQIEPLAEILSFTPLAAAFQLPFDLATGAWLFALLRLVILGLTCWLCFAVSTWCLRHARLSVGHTAAQVKAHGLGIFTRMPDSPSGAVSARMAIYLRRDPRQLLYFLLPIIFLIVFSFQAGQMPEMVWVAVYMGAVMLSMFFANDLAYDGPGIHMQVMAGLPGKEDRRGRVRLYLLVTSVYFILECIIATFISGYWHDANHLIDALVITCTVGGVLMAGIGLAQVLSCLLIYPVASIDKPFSSPQGRPVTQGLFPFVQMLGNIFAMLPTLIAWFILVINVPDSPLMWLLAPIALVNGALVLLGGLNWGGKLLDQRQLKIVSTLDRYASL